MTTLSDKEKLAVAAIAQERIDEHLRRFSYAKFPVEPLEEWHKIFCDPFSASPETIKKILAWYFGGGNVKPPFCRISNHIRSREKRRKVLNPNG